MNKLFIILGNQLFNPKFFEKYKEHTFFLAEDYGLCTYEKHHKHKILLFLSAMRSFCDELEAKNFKVEYIKICIFSIFFFLNDDILVYKNFDLILHV